MRQNGIDMADPTFDADGNPTGGGFGRGSGIDPDSTEFQTAQKVERQDHSNDHVDHLRGDADQPR